MVRKVFGFIALLCTLVVVAAVCSVLGQGGERPAGVVPATSETVEPADDYDLEVTYTTEAGKQVFEGKIAGSLGFCVLETKSLKSVGQNPYARVTAKQGSRLIRVEAFVKNRGKSALSVYQDLFVVVAGDKTYAASSEAAMALATDGEETFFFLELNPDTKTVGYLVFELPETLDVKMARIRFSDGLFSLKRREVPLLPVRASAGT